MTCWKKAEKEETWHNTDIQRCLICGNVGVITNNEEAWNKFIEVYAGLMWKRVRDSIPESNKEDVIQDIYVKLLSHSIRWWCRKPKNNFSAFLSVVIIHAISDDLRRKSNLIPLEDEIKFQNAITDTLLKLGEDEINEEAIREALLKLSKDERNVIWLHNVEGYTIQETADILCKSEEEVKTIHKRALRHLRK